MHPQAPGAALRDGQDTLPPSPRAPRLQEPPLTTKDGAGGAGQRHRRKENQPGPAGSGASRATASPSPATPPASATGCLCRSCMNTCAVPRLCRQDLGTVPERRDRGGPANPAGLPAAGGERYLRRKHLWGCASSSFQLGGARGARRVWWEGGGMERRRRVRGRGEEREKMRCYERCCWRGRWAGSAPPRGVWFFPCRVLFGHRAQGGAPQAPNSPGGEQVPLSPHLQPQPC